MARRASPQHKAKKPPLKQRAKSFAFEGFPEKDRFGVFDPALRGWFVFAVMLLAVFLGLGIADAGGRTSSAWGFAAAAILVVGAGGAVAYRRIWRRPAERELLLRMAAEDDESRALRARLTKERAAAAAGGTAALRTAAEGPQQERAGDTPRKAF